MNPCFCRGGGGPNVPHEYKAINCSTPNGAAITARRAEDFRRATNDLHEFNDFASRVATQQCHCLTGSRALVGVDFSPHIYDGGNCTTGQGRALTLIEAVEFAKWMPVNGPTPNWPAPALLVSETDEPDEPRINVQPRPVWALGNRIEREMSAEDLLDLMVIHVQRAEDKREFAREMLTKITTAFGKIMREED